MAEKTPLTISIADIAPMRATIDALAKIAGMDEAEDGFNPRTMQRIALDAIKQIAGGSPAP